MFQSSCPYPMAGGTVTAVAIAVDGPRPHASKAIPPKNETRLFDMIFLLWQSRDTSLGCAFKRFRAIGRKRDQS
jgi:hypothetical protein